MRALLLLLCLALTSGCATMIDEHQKVADWPELQVRDNVVSFAEVVRRCGKYTTWLSWPPVACAEIHFDAKVCNIWRMEDADLEVMQHERAHCGGAMHPGDTGLADAWNAYKQQATGRAVAEALRK